MVKRRNVQEEMKTVGAGGRGGRGGAELGRACKDSGQLKKMENLGQLR